MGSVCSCLAFWLHDVSGIADPARACRAVFRSTTDCSPIVDDNVPSSTIYDFYISIRHGYVDTLQCFFHWFKLEIDISMSCPHDMIETTECTGIVVIIQYLSST